MPVKSLAEYLYRLERKGIVRCLLIGGRALEAYGILRATKDIDFLIAVSDINIMNEHLLKIGYRKQAETAIFSRWNHASFTEPDIDLMFVNDATFANLSSDSVPFHVGSAILQVPTIPRLIALKLHAVRNNAERTRQDIADIEALLRCHPGAISTENLKLLCETYGPTNVFLELNLPTLL